MALKHIIVIVIITCAFIACDNNKKSAQDTEQEQTNDPEFAGADDDSEFALTDFVGDLEEDGWEMDANTKKGLEQFESMLEGVENFSIEMNYEMLLNKHQLDRAQFDQALETANAKVINTQGKMNTDEEAQLMVASLQETLKGSGLEMTLQEAEALVAANHKSVQNALTNKHDVQGTKEQVAKLLKKNNAVSNDAVALEAGVSKVDDNFIAENLSTYEQSSNKKRMTTLQRLSNSKTKKETHTILADHYEIPINEVELLGDFPSMMEPIPSSNVAQQYFDYKPPKKIQEYLNSGKASNNFKTIISEAIKKKRALAQQFLVEAKKASAKFAKENPSWVKDGNTLENTYIDQRGNFIYLPLGDASFADVVIKEKLGYKGEYANGALHIPDMSTKQFMEKDEKICNLGLSGQLTLAFTDNALSNVNGPDLYVFEMGAIEPTNLEISKDGITWINVGKIDGGTAMVDIAPFVEEGDSFNYVRLTDLETESGIPGADIDAIAAIGGAMLLNIDSSVLFDSGAYLLKPTANKALDDLVTAIEVFPSGTITVEGHTDNDGSPSSNKTLSLKRAESVSNYIEKKLSKKFKFKQVGMGESQPIAPNDTKENKQKNRRVEILVSPTN